MRLKQVVVLMSAMAIMASLSSLAHAQQKVAWRWSGYTQVRYDFFDSDYGKAKPDSDFLIRRARVKFEADVDPDTTITLQADLAPLINDESTSGSGNVQLKDAVITRKLGPERCASLGYASIPFGYEVPTPDAIQLPLERTQAASQFFPGERDTGLYFHYRPIKSHWPQVDLGYSNGLHDWYNTTSGNKDLGSHAIDSRVQWALKNGGVAGLSYYWADRDRGPAGGETTDFNNQNVFGAHVRYLFCPNWTVQGEYYDGKVIDNSLNSQDAKGWYGLAAYSFTSKPLTLFYRYDTYDQDCQQDQYQRSIAGIVWDRTKCDRATLQLEDISNNGSGNDYFNVYVQYQVKY